MVLINRAEPPTAAARYRNSRRVNDGFTRFIRTSSGNYENTACFTCVLAIAVPGIFGAGENRSKKI
jgi:hypothetical protein